MSELKTKVTDASVTDFLTGIDDEQKRADSVRLLELFSRVTGEQPKMWGSSIIGFGSYHYKSTRSSQEGDWPRVSFSPRKQALTLYVIPLGGDVSGLLKNLGKYKTSVGCLYIKRLADIDMQVLEKVIESSYQQMQHLYP